MDRRERLAAAGRWLHEQRERRGISASQLAEQLGVLPQSVYSWEAGKTGLSDERAKQLADLFGMPEIEVRRNLGLWVPEPDADSESATSSPTAAQIAELEALLDRATKTLRKLKSDEGRAAG